MTKHHVKSWAHFFDAIKAGTKLHDLRKLDRDYKVGDILVFQRYDNINGEYTGEELEAEITYITSNKVPCAFSSSALDKNYGIFSLKVNSNSNIIVNVTYSGIDDRTIPLIRKDGVKFATGGFVRPRAGSSYMPLVGEKTGESVTPPDRHDPLSNVLVGSIAVNG